MPSLSFLSSFDGSVGWKSVYAMNRTHLQFQLRRCVKCCLTGGLKTLAPGHLAPDGPGRHTELSPHHGVKAHASLHIIYLAEDFWGVFLFVLHLACLTSPGIQDLLQNYVADSLCIVFIFFPSLHAVCFGMLSPYINNRVPKLIHHASTENDDKITSSLKLTICWCRIYYPVHLKHSTEVT